MGRLLPGLVAAALLAGLAAISITLLGRPAAMSGVDGAMLSASGLALLLSAAAVLMALAALRSARSTAADMRRLEASMEAVLRSRPTALVPERAPASDTRDGPKPGADAVAAAASHDGPPADGTDAATNVVPLRSPAQERMSREPAATPASVLAAAAAVDAEISLQPIMSVSHGTTLGFDVFRSVECDGRPVHLRDIAEPPAGFDAAAFDAQTVAAAVAVARRRLGNMPEQALHVALSGAFLESAGEVDRILAMAREYPLIGKVIILCADARSFDPGCVAHASLSRLAAGGFGLAADMAEGQPGFPLSHPALRYIRIPAQRLLRTGAARLRDVAALPAHPENDHVPIIATGVADDREAMALLDLGIDVMVGDRFSAPRRIRPERLAEARQ